MNPRSLLLRLMPGFLPTLVVTLLLGTATQAFPPAPYHRIYGLVRNEYGEPLTVAHALIQLQATNGVQVSATITPGLASGINYQIDLAMDSGIAPDSYKPTALHPLLPFRIVVKIGDAIYLPIEMSGTYAQLGQPAASTRIDLTLGVDSDKDGLPDAWENWLRSKLGGTLADIRPGDDSDGDGISNLDEYLAGTFAFDPAAGFRVSLVSRPDGLPLLEFMVIQPRTYSLFSSADLSEWTPIGFRLPEDGPDAAERSTYKATDVRILRVEPVLPAGQPPSGTFFKVRVD